jgi:hypothetical protein
MSERRIVWFVVLCSVAPLASITLSSNMARADDCLVAPGPLAPGRHWYYHTDIATQKKCWHLGAASQVSNGPASETGSQQTLETLMAVSSAPPAGAKNGLSEKDAQTLYVQFLEWKRRTGQ